MMPSLMPHLEVLPPAQKELWEHLHAIPKWFVLYGGTALALHLGHRTSVDFDFFSSESFTGDELIRDCKFLEKAEVLARSPNTLSLSVFLDAPVKVSFFGGLTFGRISEPAVVPDGKVLVASLLDLAGTKAKVIQERAEAKDYRDILGLVRTGIDLPRILAAGEVLYEGQLNPMLTLKALTYFSDGDLHSLSRDEREALKSAAADVVTLPKLQRTSGTISPVSKERT